MSIIVVGAGLAGCEAAWILANTYAQKVILYEIKSLKPNPAQNYPELFAELVCSNSLKSQSPINPCQLLKSEITQMGSLLMESAYKAAIPAGETLAVDRKLFSEFITDKIKAHPNITICNVEATNIASLLAIENVSNVIIATGPLTHDALINDLLKLSATTDCFFYDAIAPIVNAETLDHTKVFFQNRQMRTDTMQGKIHDTTTGDYLNIPLEKPDYEMFINKLLEGEKVPFRNFENPKFFNACQPIEVLAASGFKTLSFGPMKPKGIVSPHTNKMPYACVQLRRENLQNQAFNMVGFQTRLTYKSQIDVFRSLPGMNNVEFFRYGSMHRNSYFVPHSVLNPDLSLKNCPQVFLAGQLMGVEGYVESASVGVFIAHLLGKKLQNQTLALPPPNTALGALLRYALTTEAKHFSPMNMNWGIFDDLLLDNKQNKDKTYKRLLMAERATAEFNDWIGNLG